MNMSVLDVIHIMRDEEKNYCLCWNSGKQRIEGIHITIDFMNLLLSLDLNHFNMSKIIFIFSYLVKLRIEMI